MSARKTASPPILSTDTNRWPVFLWLVFGANAVFFIWQCLDRFLAPRFLFLSAALLLSLLLLWKTLIKKADWRLQLYDWLLLGWYAVNLASVSWSFSWSEGIFYAQKVLLLFTTYWLVRQALYTAPERTFRHFALMTTLLTWISSLVVIYQILTIPGGKMLDNELLYNVVKGLQGNKSLATDFLFFLLVFNIIFSKTLNRLWVSIFNIALLTILIGTLQTRTVYLAVVGGTVFYLIGRWISDPAFRPLFRKKLLPLLAISGLAITALIFLKQGNGTLAERLNPLNYLESATANERRFVWYKTDELCKTAPLLGVGNGSWKILLPSQSLQGAFRLQEKGIVFTRAHNDYLEVKAEMGYIGASLFVTLFIAAFLALFWAIRNNKKYLHEILATGAGLLGYCIIQYFDFPRERIDMQVILAAFFALAIWFSNGLWQRLPGVNMQKSNSLFLAALALGLGYNILIGWNRVNGEIHTVNMMRAYSRQDFPSVLKEASLSRNKYLEYNDVVLPFEWFEGAAHYKMNHTNEALASFEKAYELNPWSFQVINNYATALAALKRYNDAIPLYEKAIGINPKYDEGKFNLAYSYTQLGDYTAALNWVQKVDTIVNPSEEEKAKNKAILENKVKFLKGIEEKRATGQ